ncbi:MAG: maleylpyruvate isomerase N-terminal domain-containing protein, partial [Acidimicrobiia bacterium]
MAGTAHTALTTTDGGDVDEVGELITTLLATPATRLTACRGWTAHELVAHLAAGAAESTRSRRAPVAFSTAETTIRMRGQTRSNGGQEFV